MKIPRLRKINEVDEKTKDKIEENIKETLKSEAIFSSFPIEEMTIKELDLLTEYAKENNLIVFLKAEHSNFHQGVLVQLIRKENIEKNIKYL